MTQWVSDHGLWLESDQQAAAIRAGTEKLTHALWRAFPRRMKQLERMGRAAPNPKRCDWLRRRVPIEQPSPTQEAIDIAKIRDGLQAIEKRRQQKLAERQAVPIVALEILSRVAYYGKCDPALIAGRRRWMRLVALRTVVTVLLRERGWSYPRIARVLGDRDHSTIINLNRNYPKYRDRYSDLARVLEASRL